MNPVTENPITVFNRVLSPPRLQHARIEACGHKYDPTRQPRMRNCGNCWLQFFAHNEQLVKDTDTMFRNQGGQRIVELQGIKYLKKFLSFMSYLAQIQAMMPGIPEETATEASHVD